MEAFPAKVPPLWRTGSTYSATHDEAVSVTALHKGHARGQRTSGPVTFISAATKLLNQSTLAQTRNNSGPERPGFQLLASPQTPLTSLSPQSAAVRSGDGATRVV